MIFKRRSATGPDEVTADRTATAAIALRPRRLRRTPAVRRLVRETRLHPSQLVAPMFVTPGSGRYLPIPSLPGQARMSPDVALEAATHLAELGVGGVLLFGIPADKDASGSSASDPEGPVPATMTAIRDAGLALVVAADVCLCEYTSHGHCGVLAGESVDNDATLERLAEAAVVYARAGADLVAPSAMMDGQVRAIRAGLDRAGLLATGILAYGSKHASALYGPFREAAGSAPAFGNRRSYQMDPANGREAMRELELDVPLAAYQVSGELAMIEAAADRGVLDRRGAALECLTAIARAGADIIVTYLAADVARWLAEPEDGR
jgi:porphobilinogen synthase